MEHKRDAEARTGSRSRPTALWAVPRSRSTVFERVFMERGDFEVLHEPFSIAYYCGSDRISDRFSDEPPKRDCDQASIL